VHETGARLTHDMKNLLQSLYTLTSMAPKDAGDGYSALLQRQLPQLSKRLEGTLEKLRSPETAMSELPVRATKWWAEVERRLAGSDIALESHIGADANVPSGLFDSFIENAVDNARAKRARDPAIRISIRFQIDAQVSQLCVRDTGAAVPQRLAQRLFREPIERGEGLGIGLYHLALLARGAGFRLELARNIDGDVRFSLIRREGDPPPPPQPGRAEAAS
jgi:signal transduction histidine kinase